MSTLEERIKLIEQRLSKIENNQKETLEKINMINNRLENNGRLIIIPTRPYK